MILKCFRCLLKRRISCSDKKRFSTTCKSNEGIMRKIYYWALPFYMIIIVIVAGLSMLNYNAPMGLFVKSYFVFIFMLAFLYSIFIDKIVLTSEIVLFCFFSIVPIASGLWFYGISSELVSHLFSFLMPIFSISFGYKLAYNFDKDNAKHILDKLIGLAHTANIIIIVVFQYLVTLGYARSSQLAPIGLVISTLYYLSQRNTKKSIVGLIFIIISGKRASLVMTLFGFFVYLNDLRRLVIKDKRLKKLFFKVMLSLSIIAGGLTYVFWNYTRYLDRFKLIFMFDFSDPYAMYVATGGRSEEIINIIHFMNEKPLRYIFGSGFGVKVEVFDNFYRHYSHFSPLSYTLIFGLIFAVVINIFFVRNIFKKSDMASSVYPFKVIFSAFWMMSLFGAVVMNDVNFWIFYGMTVYLNRKRITHKM